MPTQVTRRLAMLVTVLTLGGGCRREAPHECEHELIIYAASSLQPAFTALEGVYRATHPDMDVTLHFAGTQELRARLARGSVADVVATADPTHMAAIVATGRAANPLSFARNVPVMVVPKASPLRTFAELPLAPRIALGAPEVPIGRYSAAILAKANKQLGADFSARVEARVVARERNVRQVLMTVRFGEADAGIVYGSDALDAEGVRAIPIPAELNVVADYAIAAITNAREPTPAADWIALVTSTTGQDALRAAGFLLVEGAASAE
jgi:molybdate transport system substrate-binding protein